MFPCTEASIMFRLRHAPSSRAYIERFGGLTHAYHRVGYGMAAHPQFNVASILAHRATADVALLQLAKALPQSKAPAPLGSPLIPIAPGSRFTIAGVGAAGAGR
jgi:hypothetical protein